MKTREIALCTGNRGKFEQIRLQLDEWVRNANLANAGGTDAEEYTCSYTGDECMSVSRGGTLLVRLWRRPDLAALLEPEPQLDSVAAIAEYKARKAFDFLTAHPSADTSACDRVVCEEVVVQDSGLIVAELNDFPGPYTKYVTETIGCRGLLKLMEGVGAGGSGSELPGGADGARRAGFDGCVVHIDAGGALRTYCEPRKYWGHIAVIAETVFAQGAAGSAPEEPGGGSGLNTEASAKWGSADLDRNLFSIFAPHLGEETGQAPKTLLAMSPAELETYRRRRDGCFRRFVEGLMRDL